MVRVGFGMEITSLIHQIYDCIDDDAQWDGVLDTLFSFFDCSAASFQSVSPITGDLALWSPHGFDQSWIDEYQRDWHEHNPLPAAVSDFILATPVAKRNIAAHTDMVLGPGVFQTTHIYDGFFRRSDISDHISLPVDMTGTPTGIGIWSGHRSGRFEKGQISAATTISRHLTRAKHISNKLRYVRAYATQRELNTISDPAFIVDQHLRFLDHNDAAEIFLAEAAVLVQRRGRIDFQNGAVKDGVKRSFQEFGCEDKPAPMIPNIGAFDINNKWRVTIYALPIPTGQKYLMPLQSEFLLRFTENELRFDKIVDSIADHYALTLTEKKVATMMAAGLSVPDITQKRNTKISTTRWHVRQLFHKFDVSNQRELIRKIFLQQ